MTGKAMSSQQHSGSDDMCLRAIAPSRPEHAALEERRPAAQILSAAGFSTSASSLSLADHHR